MQLVNLQLGEILREEAAPGALPAIVDLEDVGGKTLGARRLVLAEGARERLKVGVEVALQAPVVHAAPRAVAAGVPGVAKIRASN